MITDRPSEKQAHDPTQFLPGTGIGRHPAHLCAAAVPQWPTTQTRKPRCVRKSRMSDMGLGRVKTRRRGEPIEWIFLLLAKRPVNTLTAVEFDQSEKRHSNLSRGRRVFTQPGSLADNRGSAGDVCFPSISRRAIAIGGSAMRLLA